MKKNNNTKNRSKNDKQKSSIDGNLRQTTKIADTKDICEKRDNATCVNEKSNKNDKSLRN